MKETLVRAATALVLLVLVALWFLWLPSRVFAATTALLAGMLWAEGARFLGLRLWWLHGLVGAGCAGAWIVQTPPEAALAGAACSLALALAEMRGQGALALAFAQAWMAGLANAFAVLVVALHATASGRRWLVGAAVGVRDEDTEAYFAGRAIGGARLAPAISPGKTTSGLAAGLLAGTAVAAGLWAHWGLGGWMQALVAAFALAVAAVVGDLAISAAKRIAGVKDAGDWLPGHGGLWDRVDALALALPLGWSVWRLAAS